MSGLMYAVPHEGNPPIDAGPRREVMRAAGLSYLADLPFDCFGAVIDGKSHWVFNPSAGEKAKPKYWPQEQRWEDFGDYRIGCWVSGTYTASRPRPEDLARPDQYWSYALTLGDGQKWHVPIVPVDLPRTFRMRSGNPVMEVDPRYAGLSAKADVYWDAEQVLKPMREDALAIDRQRERIAAGLSELAGDEQAAAAIELERMKQESASIWARVSSGYPAIEQQCLDCCELLSLNYYVQPNDVSFLGLLNPKAVGMILYCCYLDRRAVDESESAKKKAT